VRAHIKQDDNVIMFQTISMFVWSFPKAVFSAATLNWKYTMHVLGNCISSSISQISKFI